MDARTKMRHALADVSASAFVTPSTYRRPMRPILREHTHDGRVVGDPLPLALGIDVEPDVVPVLELALATFMLPGELALAVARVADRTWEMYYVLSSHHASRVALGPGRVEARVVACAYEHMRGGLIDVRLDPDELVQLGPLAHPRDVHLIRSAMSNLVLPEGSDGRHRFVQADAVLTGSIRLAGEPEQGMRRTEAPPGADRQRWLQDTYSRSMQPNETTLKLDEPFELKGKKGRVTGTDLASVTAIRGALAALARAGGTISYGELRTAARIPQPPAGLGRLLDLVGIDCSRRGEPNLASLVVGAETGEVREGYGNDAAKEREAVYRRWSSVG